jgi:hypothetical protein
MTGQKIVTVLARREAVQNLVLAAQVDELARR